MDTRSGQIYDPNDAGDAKKLRQLLEDEKDAAYLREMGYHPTPYQRETRKVGRNDPCPCGSQRKFKRCCWGRAKAREGTDG